MPGRGEVDVDHLLEVGEGLGLDGGRTGEAGIVDQHVERAQRALDLGGQSLAIGRDSEVGGERMDRRMQFGERLEPVGAAGGDGHGGSGIREHERHTMAEARGCAGDERGATGEVEEICRRGDGTDRIGVGHRVLRR